MSTRKSTTTKVTTAAVVSAAPRESSTPPETADQIKIEVTIDTTVTDSTTSSSCIESVVENSQKTETTATTTAAPVTEMGSTTSSFGGSGGAGVNNSSSESEATTPTATEAPKVEFKQMTEPKRITRNSPLLLASPSRAAAAGKKKLSQDSQTTENDSEPTTSGSEDKPTEAESLAKKVIRGRRSLKEAAKYPAATETASSSAAAAATSTANNRMTRKSAAQDLAPITRMTRARRVSISQAETPPKRRRGPPRKVSAAAVVVAAAVEPAGKRKRSSETPTKCDNVDNETTAISAALPEPSAKFIKIEAKEDTETEEELPPPVQAATASFDPNNSAAVQVKQEIIESSSMSEESVCDFGSGLTRSSRLRNRKQQPPPLTAQHNSPNTRLPRNAKMASPSPSECKRRKIAVAPTSAGITTTKLSSFSLRPDEDSKDSLASSMDDMMTIVEIKKEKLTAAEIDDEDFHLLTEESEQEQEKPDSPVVVAEEATEEKPSNGIEEPLSVNTILTAISAVAPKLPVVASPSAVTPEPSTSTACSASEKSASLSPELISEGVSEICVKQFYKKPEFLENNLGIEKDPKLGEIVQSASGEKHEFEKAEDEGLVSEEKTKNTSITKSQEKLDSTSVSNESIKEGELRFEESSDERKSLLGDDLSTSNLSPLVVDEDDEEVEGEVLPDVSDAVSADEQPHKEVIEEEGDGEEEQAESETISMDNNPSTEDDDGCEMDQEDGCDVDSNASDKVEKEKIEIIVKNVTGASPGNENCDDQDKLEEDESGLSLRSLNKEIISDLKHISLDKREEQHEVVTIKPKGDDIQIAKQLPDAEDNKSSEEGDKEVIIAATRSKEVEEEDETFPKLALEDEEEEDKEESSKLEGTEQLSSSTEMDVVELEEVEEAIPLQHKAVDEEEKDDATLKFIEDANKSTDCIPAATQEQKKEESSIEINVEQASVVLTTTTTTMGADDVLPKIEEKLKIIPDDVIEENKENVEVIVIKKDEAEGIHKAAELPVDDQQQEKETPIDVEEEDDEKIEVEIKSADAAPSLGTSPAKSKEHDVDTTTTIKSSSSSCSSTSKILAIPAENDETLRQKEQHLKNLGLLTHKAAEKHRQAFIQNAAASSGSTQNSKKNGNGRGSASYEYTGTLKTVIKLNRNSTGTASTTTTSNNNGANGGTSTSGATGTGRKGAQNSGKDGGGGGARRQSLKITFQKGRGRPANSDRALDNHSQSEDSYYTIQNENEGATKPTPATEQNATTVQTHDSSSHSENQEAPTTSSKSNEKEEILIPEKASSFKFHPGRLCQDQCFYCSGKFGLYDTPCHVAQIKSVERQQKILANEEKLTVDNCLCDACFRHVDRRANVPSYKKRLSGPGHSESSVAAVAVAATTAVAGAGSVRTATSNNNSSAMPTTETLEEHQSISGDVSEQIRQRKCLVPECSNVAAHSLRRKCIRKSVKKFLLNFDMSSSGTYVSLCQSHYDAVIQCSGCVLCKRRLGRTHMYHITSDTDRLEKALAAMGIPVQLGLGTAVCKLCRYFANLLMKPPEIGKTQKAEFVKNYRKRLLQFHNIHEDNGGGSDVEDEEVAKNRKKDGGGGQSSSPSATSSSSPQKAAKRRRRSSVTVSTALPKDKCSITTSNESGRSELPSPTVSTGSSVECIGETDSIQETTKTTNNQSATEAAPTNTSSAAKATASVANQMILDNDVMVDYDVPMISSDSASSSPSPPSISSKQKNQQRQQSKLEAILQNSRRSCDERNDISNVLRSNPNISMRELFPGEEDLGLQFKAPFGSSNSQRTPEGWTRIQTFLQYDEPTRRLWEDLQKPYGNQSSFLRHLILLEKYYRNGDLVLSQNASSNATVYSQTVRNRLTSYDSAAGIPVSVPSPPAKNSEDLTKELRSRSVSVDKIQRQLSSNAVTITARPKEPQKTAATASTSQQQQQQLPTQISLLHGVSLLNTSRNATNSNNQQEQQHSSCGQNMANTNNTPSSSSVSSAANTTTAAAPAPATNSRSILKTNLLGLKSGVEIVPISSASSAATISAANDAMTKQLKLIAAANKLVNKQVDTNAALQKKTTAPSAASSTSSSASTSSSTHLTSPPELISLNRHSGSTAANNNHNHQNSNNNSNNNNNSSNNQSNNGPPANNKRLHLLPKPGQQGCSSGSSPSSGRVIPPNVVILPDMLTQQQRLQSKSWRPTLMPVTANQHHMSQQGPLYQTADGRRLPALVQVQSGGRPFLISIHDYNRMCILRREKLLRDQMLKAGKNKNPNGHSGAGTGASNRQQQSVPVYNANVLAMQSLSKTMYDAANSKRLAAKQQQQQQQLHHHHQQGSSGSGSGGFATRHQQQQQQSNAKAQQQQYQTIAPRPTASSNNNQHSQQNSVIVSSGTLHPVSILGGGSSSAVSIVPSFSGQMMPILSSAITGDSNAASVSASASGGAATGNATQNQTNSWLWNNFPDANQLLMNGGSSTATKTHNSTLMNKSGNIVSATITSKQHQQLMLDNSLMSKIPKSLTVIPQHKLMPTMTPAAAAPKSGKTNSPMQE